MKKPNLLYLFIPLFTSTLLTPSHANPPMWPNSMPMPYQYQWPAQAKQAQSAPNAMIFPPSNNMQMQRYWQNNRQAIMYPNTFTQPRFPMLPQQYSYPAQAMQPKQAYIYPPQYPQQATPYKNPAVKKQAYIYPPQHPQQAVAPYKHSTLKNQHPNTSNNQMKKRQKKKPWGDVRYIWPDFYTDSTGDMWDNMVNAPYDAGRMPGGWRFPSLSSPDPVTVSDAITNQFPPIVDEMPNFMPLMN